MSLKMSGHFQIAQVQGPSPSVILLAIKGNTCRYICKRINSNKM